MTAPYQIQIWKDKKVTRLYPGEFERPGVIDNFHQHLTRHLGLVRENLSFNNLEQYIDYDEIRIACDDEMAPEEGVFVCRMNLL